MTIVEDITNNRYGKLFVINKINCKGDSKWLCKCDCGNETSVFTYNLKNGNSKSCGDCVKGNNKKDLYNKKFNKLLVIDFGYRQNNQSYWYCWCDCGYVAYVRSDHLQSGKIKTCGCGHNNVFTKNLVGVKFNRLLVMNYLYTEKFSSYWECKCDCGNFSIVSASNLGSGGTTSCGCYLRDRMSGENHPLWNSNRDEVELNRYLHKRCSSLLDSCLKRLNTKKENNKHLLLGYSVYDLARHLNIKFKSNLKDMEIDHIFPVQAFVDYGITDLKIINSLDNLQLLTRKENGASGKWYYYDKVKFEEWLIKKGCL